MRVNNFEVSIATATGPLTEYEDPDENDSEVRYIQVQEGCAWELCIRLHDIHQSGPEANAMSVDLHIDGICVEEAAFPISQSPVVIRDTLATRAGGGGGGMILRAFTFAKINVTEDQDHIGQAHRELGETKVVLGRYIRTGAIGRSEPENFIEAIKHVHEKDLKGRDITHAIGYRFLSPLLRRLAEQALKVLRPCVPRITTLDICGQVLR
jgi:hypothetical protein